MARCHSANQGRHRTRIDVRMRDVERLRVPHGGFVLMEMIAALSVLGIGLLCVGWMVVQLGHTWRLLHRIDAGIDDTKNTISRALAGIDISTHPNAVTRMHPTGCRHVSLYITSGNYAELLLPR